MENISRNNNAWGIRKSDIGRNTFVVKDANNPTTKEMHEEVSKIRTDLGLVLEHVSRGAKKINMVNYLTKPPSPLDEYYYKEYFYVVNEQTRGFKQNAQGSNHDN